MSESVVDKTNQAIPALSAASNVSRICARFIDWILITALAAPILIWISYILKADFQWINIFVAAFFSAIVPATPVIGILLEWGAYGHMDGWENHNTARLFILLPLLIECVYYTVMESSKHQGTIGKMLLKIKVVDSKGEKIRTSRSILRYGAKAIGALIIIGGPIGPYLFFIQRATVGLLYVVIGLVFICFSAKKQALYDLIAGTFVIANRADFPLAEQLAEVYRGREEGCPSPPRTDPD